MLHRISQLRLFLLLPVLVVVTGCAGLDAPAPLPPAATSAPTPEATASQPRPSATAGQAPSPTAQAPAIPTSTPTAQAPAIPTSTPTAPPTAATTATAVPVAAEPTSTPVPPTPQPMSTSTPRPADPTPAPSPSPAVGSPAGPVVLGYYVPYDGTSWVSFQAQAGDLDYVAAQWVSVNACGYIGSRDNQALISYAREHGVKVLPSLLTTSGWLNARLLNDPATTDRFLTEIVNYVVEMDYPGFDLDLEGINQEDRDAFSAFVARLAAALHQRGKTLTLAIPAKTSDVRTGWAGPYDYTALGKHADQILLMTYDYSWSSGPPGSIAPQEWVDKVAAYAVSQIPREKVLLGLAFYGYDWNRTMGGRARALQYSQSAALARQYGTEITTDPASRSGTFSYTAKAGDTVPPPPAVPALQHDITVRPLEPCAVQPPPTPTPTPRATPTPAPLQERVVWLEDANSIAARLEIAVRHGIGGVGAWRLGQEDPAVWPHLIDYRSGP
jgi:spore germination protein YaaH